jgi:hypothetical protein
MERRGPRYSGPATGQSGVREVVVEKDFASSVGPNRLSSPKSRTLDDRLSRISLGDNSQYGVTGFDALTVG